MLFSIILPVYNAEKTLPRCIAGILSQDFRDYEILIIDDESTDQSWQQIQKLAQEYDFIKSERITHGGPGKARNTALDMASGEYVLFIDADDYWLEPNLLSTLNAKIRQHRTDIFMYQMLKVTESGKELIRYRKPPFAHENVVLRLKDVYSDLVADGQALASACNKCINRELLANYHIWFRENITGEDIDWVLQLFSYVRTICLMNLNAYAYTQHKRNSRSNQHEQADDLFEIVADWAAKLQEGKIRHSRAVAGLVAFEYGICMGNVRYMSEENRRRMRNYIYFLKYGLDRKTKLIYRVYGLFGYRAACLGTQIYLLMRKIW